MSGRNWLALAGALAVAATLAVSRAQEMPVFPKRPPPPPPKFDFDPKFPSLGTSFPQFPAGPAKKALDAACVRCHSADITMQQRLTAGQWRAELAKMIGWGAYVPEDKKAVILAYLVKNFGPDRKPFVPIEARPAGY